MLQKIYQYLKPVLLYLTYFCMVCGIIMAMVYNGSIFNSLGFKIATVGMFAFWITFFALKFDWFADAEFLDRRVALWMGLVSSALLLVLQAYIRYTYGHTGLISMPHLLPTYAYLETYQSYLIIARYVLVGILGFAAFSALFADGDQVGYNFVEVTTYFTDSGFAYNQTVSDVKTAVWGYILVGLATTVLPFLVSMNPLLILVFGYFLLRLLRHSSKKAVWIKRVVIWVFCLAASALLVLANQGIALPSEQNAILGYRLEVTDEGEEYYAIKAVLNETVATHITIPETYKGKPVRASGMGDRSAFDRCERIKCVKASLDMAQFFPQAEELVLTSGAEEITSPFSYKNAKTKRIEIAYDAERIGYQAFRRFTHLCEVILPDTLVEIGMQAFLECTSLRIINLPEGLITIGDNAFQDCKSLTQITLPQSLTTLGDNAFTRCHSLATITIPEGITRIGEAVFAQCSFPSIVLPESVTEIDYYAFNNCDKLTSVTLGSKVTVIGDGAFANCEALSRVILPKSLTRISYNAVYNTNITLYYEGSATEWAAVSKLLNSGYLNEYEASKMTVKFFSETEAEGCWYYDANGEIAEW